MANNQTYKGAYDKLVAIVDKLESNEFSIDELLKNVKQATELIDFCKECLHKTDAELEKIIEKTK